MTSPLGNLRNQLPKASHAFKDREEDDMWCKNKQNVKAERSLSTDKSAVSREDEVSSTYSIQPRRNRLERSSAYVLSTAEEDKVRMYHRKRARAELLKSSFPMRKSGPAGLLTVP
ncbi:hypothetical protein NDN08_004701 [Rhodosorus marinus]|uniref:Nuclear transcription factor Y subunit n=1 Tax=Rhodosorus marinus TaxID=101924 RepID=A0AAV8UR25_9RHOD|nr:hypothetical protein NDN08_004701 [Rhodosorus marinus]